MLIIEESKMIVPSGLDVYPGIGRPLDLPADLSLIFIKL